MKDDQTMRHGIEAALKAMAHMLDQAAKVAHEAHGYICRNEQNLAIGTVVGLDDTLERAATLLRAVLAMHRFRP